MLKFAEHFMFIAAAMDRIGDNHDELWDEEDGFFYDVLRLPDGQRTAAQGALDGRPPAAVRDARSSPLEGVNLSDDLVDRLRRRLEAMPELLATIHDLRMPGVNGRRMLAVLDETSCAASSPGCSTRTSSSARTGCGRCPRYHVEHPFAFDVHGQTYEVHYLPAESDTGLFGGNSNWRGPVWFPVNFLVLRGLLHLYAYYGDDFKVECPTGSGNAVHAVRGGRGARPAARVDLPARRRTGAARCTAAPRSSRPTRTGQDLLLFYEYFHGDNGAGLGASHQTGWTGLVARVIQGIGYLTPDRLLAEDVGFNLVYRPAAP